MIEVKIRDIRSADSISLGEFSPYDLDGLVKAFHQFGCFIEDYNAVFYSARFVANSEVYFEIVIENNEG